MLRPSVTQDITDIEIPTDQGMIDLIEKCGRLYRTQNKIIPYVFQADFYAGFLDMRDYLSNRIQSVLISCLIGNLVVHHTRYHQYGISPQFFYLLKGDGNRLERVLALSGLPVG